MTLPQQSQKEITISASVLVGYATRYSSMQEVVEAVAATLREQGLEVDIQSIRKVRTLAGYSVVVLGRHSTCSVGTRTRSTSCRGTVKP
jgi:flavorubredoxin